MNKSILSLGLALAALVFTATQGHAQIIFEFTPSGPNNVVVSGSGSATTGPAVGTTNRVGFSDDGFGTTGPLYIDAPTPNPTPSEWVVNPVNQIGFGSTVGLSGLTIDDGVTPRTASFIEYRSGPGNPEWLYVNFDGPFPGNTLVTASGSTEFLDNGGDFQNLFTFYAPGTLLTVIPGVLHFCIGGPCAVTVTPIAIAARREVTPTVLVTDVGAIQSTMTSGLGMGLVNQQVTQGAANAALRDYDSRLFRARSGMHDIFADGFESGDTSTWTGASANNGSSLLRHLAFVQDENMSYKVALGLADPEERTVVVNVADTLSTQTGTNFNGQSLGGGLPYAMMGVPLMPMAGGAATVQIVEAAPSGKTVIDDSKAVVEMAPRNQWEVFVAGDFSFYDQDQLTDLMQGFDTDTYAGTIGIEYRVKEWLNLGLGWSYLQSDTNVSGNYGDIDLEGNLITGYATAFWRQYWADILYSYGSFNNDINRNTGLGSRARGDTDSQSHNIRLNFGRNFNVGNNITTGPIAGLQYANGDIDPYSERGGGSAALDYDGTDFESMVSRLGWQATHYRSTNWGRLVSQIHLAWEHEYMPENGTVGASLQTSPFALVTGSNVSRFGGYSAESDGAYPGTDWLSAGAGLRFELANGVAFLTDYEGVFFRSNSSQHYASAKLSYEWGAIIPSGGGGKAVSGKAVAYEAYDATSEPVADTEDPKPAPATKAEAEVAVTKKKLSGDFASWLNRKGR